MSNGNSRYLKIGPGGRRCTCCFPAPGSKDRRAQFRSAKRKAERDAMRQAENDLIDHQEMLQELQNWEDDFDYCNDWMHSEFDDRKDEARESEYLEHDEPYDWFDDYSYHRDEWAA